MPSSFMPTDTVSVLFVCLGNICRSPLAEGVFVAAARDRGLAARIEADSAGTAAYHSGEPPDPRTAAVAARHGVPLHGLARQVTRHDFRRFDLIVAMDRSNRRSLERLRGHRRHPGAALIVMMRDYDPDPDSPDVPDPYYGGADGFERVYHIVARCCEGLLDEMGDGAA